MLGSTDKNQQNGPQNAASQTQESLIPASPHHPNRRKGAKPRNRKQPEVRPGRYLGTPFGLEKNDCGNSLYGGCPRGSGVIATWGLCKNQMHHQRTNIIITPHQPAPLPEQRMSRDGKITSRGTLSTEPPAVCTQPRRKGIRPNRYSQTSANRCKG